MYPCIHSSQISVHLFVTICTSETSNEIANTKVLCFRKENTEELLILLVHAWVVAQINFFTHSFQGNKSTEDFDNNEHYYNH